MFARSVLMMTLTGVPLRALTIPPMSHPPSTICATLDAFEPNVRPCPYGIGYSRLRLNVWRTSKLL